MITDGSIFKVSLLRIFIAILIAIQIISLPVAATTAVKNSFRGQNDVLYTDDGCKEESSSDDSSGVTGAWVYPTDKSKTQISSDYKSLQRPGHRGVDIASNGSVNNQVPIYASRDGTVTKTGPADGFGYWVVIQHEVDGKRIDSVYGHMSLASIKVKPGDKVKGGQEIAKIGNEGGSTGPHLHYEEWVGGRDSGQERKPVAVYGDSQEAEPSSEEESESEESSSEESATCCGSNTAGSGGGGCGEQGYASGNRNSKANKDQIWNYFKSKGLSDTAVAGIMGNIDQESAFMPDANNNNSGANQGAVGGGCRGIVQWCAGRNEGLEKFAKEKGTDWTCLSTQLDFVWYEVTQTGEAGVMKNLNAAKTPGAAGDVWAVEYERMATHEQAGRAERAQKIFEEYNGQSGGGSETASDSGDSGSSESCTEKAADGSLVSGECAELIEKLKKYKAEGKFVPQNEQPEMQDIEDCDKVVEPANCNSGSGDHSGVYKIMLQVLVTLIEKTGKKISIYALNRDHFVDCGEHPKGLGVDITLASTTPEGQAVYKYLYDNASTLKVNKLIYDPVPGGYQCMYEGKPASCMGVYGSETLSGHQDHIHVSLFK